MIILIYLFLLRQEGVFGRNSYMSTPLQLGNALLLYQGTKSNIKIKYLRNIYSFLHDSFSGTIYFIFHNRKRSNYLMRYLHRNSTFLGELGFLLAVKLITAPSASICCNTLAMFFVSSRPRWWLPRSGIPSCFNIVIIPLACQYQLAIAFLNILTIIVYRQEICQSAYNQGILDTVLSQPYLAEDNTSQVLKFKDFSPS